MIPVVRFKDSVQLKGSPGGVRILAAFDHAAKVIGHDMTITSGCDGEHSGPLDPHHRGDAYDGRTHDLPDKQAALKELQDFLGPDFYVFIEDPDEVTHADPDRSNEHFHAQVRKGTVYPPVSQDTHDAVADAAVGQ